MVESASGKVWDAEVGGVGRGVVRVAQHSWKGEARPGKELDGKNREVQLQLKGPRTCLMQQLLKSSQNSEARVARKESWLQFRRRT